MRTLPLLPLSASVLPLLLASSLAEEATPPKTLAMARSSATSPCGVPVPCAFTYATSAGATPPSLSALRIASAAPEPFGGGAVMWCASADMP